MGPVQGVLLVKRLAPGVGLAEDPGDGSSFGEHRGRLLAGILAEPEWSALGSIAERIAFCPPGWRATATTWIGST